MKTINFYLEARLNAVKKRAIEWAKHNPTTAHKNALDWQVSYGRKGYIKYDSANDYDEKGNMRLYDLDKYDAVEIQQISRRSFDHTGYYADNFQMDLIMPKVIKIKTSRGLFVAPAIEYSDCDQAAIYFSEGVFIPKDENSEEYDKTMLSAARIADHIAEKEAERSREENAKYQAEEEIANLKYENKAALKETHNLLLEIKLQRDLSTIRSSICQVLIEKIESFRASINSNNRRIETLKHNFWEAV
jgi:hypothetical protein